jgi:hypothetical protein
MYLIKYLYEDLYYCTNDINEYNDIMYRRNVIPRTSIRLDTRDVTEIENRDKCHGIIESKRRPSRSPKRRPSRSPKRRPSRSPKRRSTFSLS